MYWLYSILLALAVVVSAPWWLLQMALQGKYRAGLKERLGRVPARLRAHNAGPTVWIHAVSVGEALAIGGLVQQLKADRPDVRVVVSTTTHTGQKLAAERYGSENVFYFPLDFAFAIRPYLQTLRPEVVVLAETEFWPNFIRLVRESGARILVANARISDRSLPRYRRFRELLSSVLSNVSAFLAQSDEDATRLRQIGAPAERISVGGNLKFEVKPLAEAPFVSELRATVSREQCSPVIVAGSTVEGEEPMVLAAFDEVVAEFPTATLILATRHKERFSTVADLLKNSGVAWSSRAEHGVSGLKPGSILLLDSLGELASVYSVADVAFVGGSLVPRGGHNILEPAYFGIPTIVGPYTENFRDIIRLFTQAEAVLTCDPDELGLAIKALLRAPARSKEIGERGRQLLETQRGATERTVHAIEQLLAVKQ